MCGVSTSIYVAAAKGQLYCLDPTDGKIQWSFDLADEAKAEVLLCSTPFVVIERVAGGERRRIYLGAGVNNSVSSAALLYCFEDRMED